MCLEQRQQQQAGATAAQPDPTAQPAGAEAAEDEALQQIAATDSADDDLPLNAWKQAVSTRQTPQTGAEAATEVTGDDPSRGRGGRGVVKTAKKAMGAVASIGKKVRKVKKNPNAECGVEVMGGTGKAKDLVTMGHGRPASRDRPPPVSRDPPPVARVAPMPAATADSSPSQLLNPVAPVAPKPSQSQLLNLGWFVLQISSPKHVQVCDYGISIDWGTFLTSEF